MSKRLAVGIVVFLVAVVVGLVAANAVISSPIGPIKAGFAATK